VGIENLASTRMQSPDHPVCSQSIYRLHYPGPLIFDFSSGKTGFSASPSRRSMKGAIINGVTYEVVAKLIYLGTLISNETSIQKEIQRRILAGNRTYFAAISLFRNKLLTRATKIRLYKTLIRPIVAYGVET
jgi:hypothetical protein